MTEVAMNTSAAGGGGSSAATAPAAPPLTTSTLTSGSTSNSNADLIMTTGGSNDNNKAATAAATTATANNAAATTSNHNPATIAKLSAQMKKLNEANGKYKNLLKLAKERIQQQEEELETLRQRDKQQQKQQQQNQSLGERAVSSSYFDENGNLSLDEQASSYNNNDYRGDTNNNTEVHIVRVCQRMKIPVGGSVDSSRSAGTGEEVWALLEFEVLPANLDLQHDISQHSSKRFKEWRRFDTEASLQDYIRRDTGEPLTLPPYALSPDQSARIQHEAAQQVAKITEEFRRFRVRSELARKQADVLIRDLQSHHVQNATRRIEDNSSNHNSNSHGIPERDNLSSPSSRGNSGGGSGSASSSFEIDRLRAEMAAQEAHWQEAYNVLLAENKALRSVGSEALLASQWRQRYETCQKEKDDLEAKVKSFIENASTGVDAAKYEAKYRDLKESFRLYRKKAKEIFEQQQNFGGGGGSSTGSGGNEGLPFSMINTSSPADAKLSYLKNLMVHYFTSEPTMREPMEVAIGTVLQFTPDEMKRIETKKKKAQSDSWF